MRESRNRLGGWWVGATLLTVALLSSAAVQAQPVTVTVDVSGTAVPGGTVTATAMVEIADGSTLQTFAWTQTGGVDAALSGAATPTVTVNLGGRAAYRTHLVEFLSEPPIGPDQLPPNVPLPPGEFPGGLQNRFEVAGINPFALEEAGLVTLEVAVTTTSGTYHAEAEIHTTVPWKSAAGIRNVPIGVPVLLQGKEQDAYDWTLDVPAGSSATLAAAGSRNPEFTPDVPGIYALDVTDEASGGPVEIVIYAGTWRGVIVGQDEDGRPVADELCTGCHRPGFAPDIFPQWAQTGHAEIFSDSLDTNSHYSSRCFACHTVGYDTSVANGGVDEAAGYQAFLDAGLLSNPGDNWDTVLEQFPDVAQQANIQCENCHGPNSSDPGMDTLAHGWMADVVGEPRVSLSADVCATCHGEPLRHARFQQWQLSGHANFELAIDEGDSGNCSRCHTANGFLTWLPILLGDEEGDPLDNIEVAWTTDETFPQTCVACHDPHDIGTTTGVGTNARVRISGNTPDLIAGFQVFGAGRGALCMTCHNSRRGLRNDATFEDFIGTSEVARAPHGSSQTDVLMGENAFFVNTGVRGSHSLIADTCVMCHMESTPPPDLLSYNQGGTNHTFFASPDICADCHGEIINAETIQSIVGAVLDDLTGLIEEGWREALEEQIAAGNRIDLDGEATITDADDIAQILFGEFRGRQALTVVLTDDTVLGPFRIPDIEVLRPAPMPPVALSDVANPDLLKAGWNWNLVNNDGSRGVHNPSYVLQVLDGARDAVGGRGRGGPRAVIPQVWLE